MLRVKAPADEDWKEIDRLASNEVQEADHSQYESHWTRRRREFDGEKYESVLLNGDAVVGFCSLEKDPAHKGLRAFMVLDWSSNDGEVQQAALSQLDTLIRQSGAPEVWMRELEDDQKLLRFMTQHGFHVEKRYEIDGTRFVNLARSVV